MLAGTVIKVLWGSEWDGLFASDKNHVLLRRFAETVDGQYQNLGANDGDYNRAKFFQLQPESAALVEHLSDAEINALTRGGHDFRKLYAAFASARAHSGRPTVILAKTKKGYGMGDTGESRVTSHQAKKLDIEALKVFRDRFSLPLSDEAVARLDFYKPAEDSPEMRYLRSRAHPPGEHFHFERELGRTHAAACADEQAKEVSLARPRVQPTLWLSPRHRPFALRHGHIRRSWMVLSQTRRRAQLDAADRLSSSQAIL